MNNGEMLIYSLISGNIIFVIFSIVLSVSIIVCYFKLCSRVKNIDKNIEELLNQNNEQNENLEGILKVALMIKNQK